MIMALIDFLVPDLFLNFALRKNSRECRPACKHRNSKNKIVTVNPCTQVGSTNKCDSSKPLHTVGNQKKTRWWPTCTKAPRLQELCSAMVA